MIRDSLLQLIRVRVISQLGFCNSLYYGLPKYQVVKLQRIMNSPDTPSYIRQLHWLPFQKRIILIIILFVHVKDQGPVRVPP